MQNSSVFTKEVEGDRGQSRGMGEMRLESLSVSEKRWEVGGKCNFSGVVEKTMKIKSVLQPSLSFPGS